MVLDPRMVLGDPCVPAAARLVDAEILRAKQLGVRSLSTGCKLDPERGIVPCDPEAMRKVTERILRERGLYPAGKRLSPAVYAMARNIGSEGGSGSGAEKLALGEALVNRARDKGVPMEAIMQKDGFFARQRGCNPCVSSARDPGWADIVAAELVLGGASGGIARGATHYYSPASMDAAKRKGGSHDRFSLYDSWISGGDLLTWVGYVPGVNLERQFFLRRMPKTAEGRSLSERMGPLGRVALGRTTPGEIKSPPTCAGSAFVAAATGVEIPGAIAAGVAALTVAATTLYLVSSYGGAYSSPWRRA